MPNHFYFVVKVRSKDIAQVNAKKEVSSASTAFQKGELSLNAFVLDQYRRFFSSYSLSLNFRYRQKGQIFLKRFKRISLQSDYRISRMICYLHYNPIHHRFTKEYKIWKYSSYGKYLDDADDFPEHKAEIIEKYFGSSCEFIEAHRILQREGSDDFKFGISE